MTNLCRRAEVRSFIKKKLNYLLCIICVWLMSHQDFNV